MENKKVAKTDDLGLDNLGTRNRQRAINPDGSFNIVKINTTGRDIYRWFITSDWRHYWIFILVYYTFINLLFAVIYWMIGADELSGMSENSSTINNFSHCFFFSVQTFTTVGYGAVHPIGFASNIIAGIEACLGLMTFALTTGTLFGRFSKARPRIKFSQTGVICPYKSESAFMFMIANERNNSLLEVEATLNYSYLSNHNKQITRQFVPLTLEIGKISMLALNWVIVHSIDPSSPLYNKSEEDIKKEEGEFYVLIKAFDDTYSQYVHSRYSYMAEELEWGKKFERPFYVNKDGITVIDLSIVGKTIPA